MASDATGFGRADVDVVMPSDPVATGVVSPDPPPALDGINCFPGMTPGVLVARTNSDGCGSSAAA